MPPRAYALPEAATESAREARKSFFCDLCGKGYARTTDYESHLDSYDHLHRQRMKDMRQLTRGTGTTRTRTADEEAGLSKISLPLKSAPSASAAKGVSGFTPVAASGNADLARSERSLPSQPFEPRLPGLSLSAQQPLHAHEDDDMHDENPDDPSGAIRNGWAAEAYDPLRPTRLEDLLRLSKAQSAGFGEEQPV